MLTQTRIHVHIINFIKNQFLKTFIHSVINPNTSRSLPSYNFYVTNNNELKIHCSFILKKEKE